MSPEQKSEKPKPKILRVYESWAFDPERGSYRAVFVRFEYPPGQIHDIPIPKEEFTPEEAERRVKEWVRSYGVLIGKEIG